jgi:hypothetical protein
MNMNSMNEAINPHDMSSNDRDKFLKRNSRLNRKEINK